MIINQAQYKKELELKQYQQQLDLLEKEGEKVYNLKCLNRFFPPITRTKTTGLAIIVFTFHSMITIIFDTMYPVLCEAPYENNGLNLSIGDTGILLSIKGIAAIIYQATIYPIIGGKFGARTALIFCLLSWVIILIIFPLTSSLAYAVSAESAWGVLISIQIYRAIIASTGAMSLMIIINNSVPKSVLGLVSGVSQSCSSASRCIGPLWAGAMWTGSVTSSYWRLSGAVMYWILAFITFIAVYFATKLPLSVNKPMGRKKKN